MAYLNHETKPLLTHTLVYEKATELKHVMEVQYNICIQYQQEVKEVQYQHIRTCINIIGFL